MKILSYILLLTLLFSYNGYAQGFTRLPVGTVSVALPSIAPVNHTSANSADGSTVHIPAINNIGANFIGVTVNYGNGTLPTIADSRGNTWQHNIVSTNGTGGLSEVIFYCFSPLTSVAQTVTVTATGLFPSAEEASYSGLVGSTIDQQAQNAINGTNCSVSLTPTHSNELIFGGVATHTANSATITSSSCVIIDYNSFVGSLSYAGFDCGYVQGTSTTVNFTVTNAVNTFLIVNIASFQ